MSITVFGEGRGFRVVWLLEEMGVPYRLRPVDLLAGAANDPDLLAVNPGLRCDRFFKITRSLEP